MLNQRMRVSLLSAMSVVEAPSPVTSFYVVVNPELEDGVDVGSPGGTVSVGAGVLVIVAVGGTVQMGDWTGSVACG